MGKKENILIGAHMSITGGLEKAITRGESIGCTTIQIFTKNNKSYFGKKLTQEQIDTFKQQQKNSSIKIIVVHTSYLINIGSKSTQTTQKSVSSLIHELGRCKQLAIPYLVLHPGSHTGSGEAKCIKKIAKNLDIVLSKVTGSCMILLETMAGQGTNVGYTFEQLRAIYDLCKEKKRIGICFDTCHVFTAGYDLRTVQDYQKVWGQFRTIIGIRKLKVIHLNDSQTPYNSHRDRHANLGKGTIPLSTFKPMMNDPALQKIPKILETPSIDGMTEYKKEIALLKKMIQ